jgi:hypothetical protein
MNPPIPETDQSEMPLMSEDLSCDGMPHHGSKPRSSAPHPQLN